MTGPANAKPDITYKVKAPIPLDQLTALYRDVHWTVYSEKPDKMAGLLPGALWHMSAWDGERLVGLVRCVGDNCSILYIQDLLVMEAYQRRGIGARLLREALHAFAHIRQIVLMTNDDDSSRAFYTAAGLKTAGELGTVCYAQFNLER